MGTPLGTFYILVHFRDESNFTPKGYTTEHLTCRVSQMKNIFQYFTENNILISAIHGNTTETKTDKL